LIGFGRQGRAESANLLDGLEQDWPALVRVAFRARESDGGQQALIAAMGTDLREVKQGFVAARANEAERKSVIPDLAQGLGAVEGNRHLDLSTGAVPRDRKVGASFLLIVVGVVAGLAPELPATTSCFRQLGAPNVIGVDFGGAADRWDASGIAKPLYANKRAEMWGNLRDWLKAGGALPDDPELRSDLTGLEYGYSAKGEIQLEKKEDMKRRGLASVAVSPAGGDQVHRGEGRGLRSGS